MYGAISLNEDISSWKTAFIKVIKNGLTCHCDVEVQLDFVKSIRKAHVELLSSYGIILTLLASITFVAVLQPPGSFDPDGIVRSSKLVAAFMFFATSSFLLACTGLLTVAVGSAMMLHPRFFPRFEEIKVPPHTHHENGQGAIVHPSQRNHSHEHQPPTPEAIYDELTLMVNIVLDNLYRTRRLHLYMGMSLLFCVTAFLCAGFAITKFRSSGVWNLVAAIILGGLPFPLELVKVFMGPGGLPFLLEIVEVFMGPTFFWRKCCCRHDLRAGQPAKRTTTSSKLFKIIQSA